MLLAYFQEIIDLDTRDITVKSGAAMLCGVITSMAGHYISPLFGTNAAIFIGAAVGYLLGTALMYKVKKEENR
ncbi:hypothetical protein [Pseudomonas gorinensis]